MGSIPIRHPILRSPSGKAAGFGPAIRGFESYSQNQLGWSNGKMQVSKTLRWGFKSLTLRQVLLAQWNRAVGYEPMCREFESLKGRLTNSQKFVTI